MRITASDPLELLPYKAGIINTPKEEAAGKGTQQLDVRQKALEIGEPIPIVFCRRLNDNGGVWISPGASEGRFENDSNNNLNVYYQLVLSEGQLPQIPLADLYQGPCKIGTYYQTYNRRAGTWLPGSFISSLSSLVDTYQFSFDPVGTVNPTWYNATRNQYGGWQFIYNGQQHYYPGSPTPGPGGPVLQTRIVTGDTFKIQDTPLHCGTSGTYANLTTLSFEWQYPNGDDKWDRQIHAYIRNGMQVTRILDSTYGPSNNIVDLALYLISQSSRLPSNLVDTTAMLAAANFTNTNLFFYNGEFKESGNLEDWLQNTASKFLLRLSDKDGKKGFRPLVPINNDYTIKTTAVEWVFTFTEDHILPDGFEIDYISLSERKPICALVLWRQQPENDVGVVRTTEVRFNGEAANGPFEQYDLSEFCTTENHAVKVGAYYVARRKYISHSLRIRVKPDTYGGTLAIGDLVRVTLIRETDVSDISYHDYLYEVERISKNITGIVELDLIHFPVDSSNRSLVALAVSQAAGAGYLLPTGRADFSCNYNTSTTPIADVGGNLPGLPGPGSFDTDLDAGSEGQPSGGNNNAGYPPTSGDLTGDAQDGSTLTAGGVCPGAYIEWYRCPTGVSISGDGDNVPSLCQQVSAGSEEFNYTLTSQDVNNTIYAIGRCPDPSSPDGYGNRFTVGSTNPVAPNFSQYQYVRFVYTIVRRYLPEGVSETTTGDTDWFTFSTVNPPYIKGKAGTLEGEGTPFVGSAWRSSASARFVVSFRNLELGGVGNVSTGPGIDDGTLRVGGDFGYTWFEYSGSWEYSNDASTVAETYIGIPDDYVYQEDIPV